MRINQVRLISHLIVAFVLLTGAWSLHSLVSPDLGHDHTDVGTTSGTCRANPPIQTVYCQRR
ncbi:hypothetical protein ACIB24_05800 [Spongisporangium articulatum]|uniref:Uncharacterized protein n=1 Tax=Spongisporangium articulatum TaxID=3362603 RepID=A0ABW8AJM7_9ACTN